MATTLLNVHSYLPLPSKSMMVLFQLAISAHCVTMPTTETTLRKTIQRLILLVFEFHELMKRICDGATS